MRVQWLFILLSLPTSVRVLRDPEALRFFGIAIVVVGAAFTVGSVVALAIRASRRSSTGHLSIR